MNNLKYYFCVFFVLFSISLFACESHVQPRKRKLNEKEAYLYITGHGLMMLECEGHQYVIEKIHHYINCSCSPISVIDQ